MGHGDLSHTEVSIEANLSETYMYEADVWDKSFTTTDCWISILFNRKAISAKIKG